MNALLILICTSLLLNSLHVSYINMPYERSKTVLWRLPFVIYSRADQRLLSLDKLSEYLIITD